MTASQRTPASVLTHDDISSEEPPQHDAGVHAVHAHITVCSMLNPGSGGG
jgi:hypothetical protein